VLIRILDSGVAVAASLLAVALARTLRRQYQASEDRAATDALTGLPNRRETFRRLAALTNANAADSPSVALAFCDLDHFKQINDRHGHAAGDALLQCVGERLQRVLRCIDLVGRIGGDELLVMLVGVSNIKEALALAEAMRVAVREPVAIGATSVTTTLSIGITLCRPGESVDALVARADAAMYQAKQAGRDRIVPISAEALPAAGS
jgi:diguanylate cyclase (GGDEF)-like protein